MTNDKQSLAANATKGMNPIVAGAIGAVVGAAAVGAGVAAVVLDDKKHEAVDEKVGEFKEKGQEAYDAVKKTVSEVKDKVQGVKKD